MKQLEAIFSILKGHGIYVGQKWTFKPIDLKSAAEEIETLISSRADVVGSTDLINTEWQKCPKCDGQGIVSRPPWIAGDVYEWSSTSVSHQCNVCNGKMIIPQPPKTAQQ